ncbi:MAG: hypothetical protein HY314_11710 [Acidobacteria bacterium]|nr:hypothetical protein [Acidobacteriota bacterium]
MTCPSCGVAISYQGHYCKNCGSVLRPSMTNATFVRPLHDEAPTLPSWRLEVRERVRAFRARRQREADLHQLGQHSQAEEPVAPVETSPRSSMIRAMLNWIRT